MSVWIAAIILLFAAWPAFGEGPAWRLALARAELLQQQGNYAEAEAAAEAALKDARALADEKAAATVWNNLAGLYLDSGRCELARQAYLRSLHVWEKAGEAYRPQLFRAAINLFSAYLDCGEPGEAERINDKVLERNLEWLPRESVDYARLLVNRGNLALIRKQPGVSERLLLESLAVWTKADQGDPQIAFCLNLLALAEAHLGKRAAAETHTRRAYSILERHYPPEHPMLVKGLNNMATIYFITGNVAQAEEMFRQALARVQALGPNSPMAMQLMLNYGVVLRKQGRKSEASRLEQRAAAIRAANRPERRRQSVDVSELSAFR